MAEEVRQSRYQLRQSDHTIYQPLGKQWIYRFQTRYPALKGIWTRQIDANRHPAALRMPIEQFFNAVTEMFMQYNYANYVLVLCQGQNLHSCP